MKIKIIKTHVDSHLAFEKNMDSTLLDLAERHCNIVDIKFTASDHYLLALIVYSNNIK